MQESGSFANELLANYVLPQGGSTTIVFGFFDSVRPWGPRSAPMGDLPPGAGHESPAVAHRRKVDGAPHFVKSLRRVPAVWSKHATVRPSLSLISAWHEVLGVMHYCDLVLLNN